MAMWPRTECVIKLSERDLQMVLDAHDNPPEPTAAMKKAWRRYHEGLASGRITVRESGD
ncbi:MAG: type II toxin -antitoxin system TacA 1-like antitoxin [Rhodospirillales bacterium]